MICIVFAGWFNAGSHPKSYEMGIDKGKGQDGKNAATIKSKDQQIDGFGTLMQTCKPDKYLGQRVKMSGYMKSENVTSWAGFWFRVDKAGSKESLAFDNMQNRPVKSTTAWIKYEIILDVPSNASLLAYGALLSGTGQIWFDKVKFEIVGVTLKTTDLVTGTKNSVGDKPINLDFEK
jgi:hypothetical protein